MIIILQNINNINDTDENILRNWASIIKNEILTDAMRKKDIIIKKLLEENQ